MWLFADGLNNYDSKVHVPTWAHIGPVGPVWPHIVPMNLAIRESMLSVFNSEANLTMLWLFI